MEIVTHSYHHSYNYYFRIFAYHGNTNFCKLSARKILPELPPSINWMVYWHQQHSINGTNLMVNKSVISWKSDREHKFGKHVFPQKNPEQWKIGSLLLWVPIVYLATWRSIGFVME
ncbi:unnamed protein product [Lathyrus oleraceus]